MKKALIFSAFFIASINAFSQSGYLTDGIRFSENIYGSTARNMGIGAASNSLGGDLGSISINPASAGVYRSSEFVFTTTLNSLEGKSNFNGFTKKDHNYNFAFDNIGLVMNFKTQGEIQGFSLAFGYNKLNDYNSNYIIQNNSITNRSFANYFLEYADGLLPSELDDYWEGIAYDVYIIDSAANRQYYSPFVGNGLNMNIKRNLNLKGSLGEYYTAFGANISNKFYLGASVNIRAGYYEESFDHTELNNANNETFKFSRYINSYYRSFNAKLGMIFRPIEQIRLGLSFHTPTVGSVTMDLNSKASATTINPGTNQYETYYSDPLPADEDEFDITSPGRLIAGIAYISKIGLLSFDYEFVDYTKMKFSNGYYNDDLDIANNDVDKYFKVTHNFRIGGELKFNSFYTRAGYAFYASPYNTNEEIFKTDDTNIYSLGLGYRNSSFFADFTYSMKLGKTDYPIAHLPKANLSSNIGSYMLTLGFRF